MERSTKQELGLEFDEVDVIDEEDFAIVVSPEGELKSVFFPTAYDDDQVIPDAILQIMEVFGIKDINDLSQNRTIH